MALFGKKKSGDKPEDNGNKDSKKGKDQSVDKNVPFEPNPTKAAAFFNHAQVAHDSTNYEYAMTLWVRGIAFDPTDLDAIEKFAASALR
ncbi:MAG: hypothetical protein AAGB34_00340, partial [Planctomycetota bacterium]